jgi:DNA-binding NarL/FixJ family response regulator
MEPIRVLIVDDHPMIRHGLRSVLTAFPDIQVSGEAEDGSTALQAVSAFSPDVVLMDIQLTGQDGLAVASQLHKASPQTKIIILTAYHNDDYVASAFRAGAYAYLLKSSSGEKIVEAIRQVYAGQRLLSSERVSRVLEQFQDLIQDQTKKQFNLSTDELQVLTLIAEGTTNEDIGKKMFWGERTVKRKVEEIMEKMNAKNRAEAVAKAIKSGLI